MIKINKSEIIFILLFSKNEVIPGSFIETVAIDDVGDAGLDGITDMVGSILEPGIEGFPIVTDGGLLAKTVADVVAEILCRTDRVPPAVIVRGSGTGFGNEISHDLLVVAGNEADINFRN